MKCPRCGADAHGKFCHNCGASFNGNACSNCGASLTAGARFCHGCGTPAGGGAPARSPVTVPWIVAGGAVVVLVVVLAMIVLRPDGQGPGPQTPVARAPAGPVDLTQMSPREQADRLFNRVMSAAERGVDDTAAFFGPMALQAYAMVGALDQDARYHVGLIHLVTGDLDATLAQADSIALTTPTHLFAAILRAEVADARGDSLTLDRARRAFFTNYQAERDAARPEYDEHPGLLDRFQAEVLQALGQTAEN